MRENFHRNEMMRAAALWLVALAFAVKLLIAPGMMPVVDAGGIRITICTGNGPIVASLDIDGKHQGKQAPMAQEACPFAALAWGALANLSPLPGASRIAPIMLPLALPPLPARAPPIAVPPPATGPPSFA